jgi:hypothetical protein
LQKSRAFTKKNHFVSFSTQIPLVFNAFRLNFRSFPIPVRRRTMFFFVPRLDFPAFCPYIFRDES